MSGLIIWKDEEMNKLRRDIDRLFDRLRCDFGICRFVDNVSEFGSIRLSETADSLVMKALIPGIDPQNLDISITQDTILTIRYKRTEEIEDEEGDYYHKVKRTFGSSTRTIRLPCRVKVGEIRATYRDGILEIVMPKWHPQKPREIKVEVKAS